MVGVEKLTRGLVMVMVTGMVMVMIMVMVMMMFGGRGDVTICLRLAGLCNEHHLLYFQFAGRMMGKALFDGQLVDVHLTPPLFKHMLGSCIDRGELLGWRFASSWQLLVVVSGGVLWWVQQHGRLQGTVENAGGGTARTLTGTDGIVVVVVIVVVVCCCSFVWG